MRTVAIVLTAASVIMSVAQGSSVQEGAKHIKTADSVPRFHYAHVVPDGISAATAAGKKAEVYVTGLEGQGLQRSSTYLYAVALRADGCNLRPPVFYPSPT